MKKYILPLLLACLLVGCSSEEVAQSQPTATPTPAVADEVTPTVEESPAPEATPEPQPSEEPTPDPVTVHVLGVGDNLIHTGIFLQASQRATDGGYDFQYTYERVADIIEAADIASINQETVMSGGTPSAYPMFNSPQELGTHLVDIGFDVINLSNNHMFDKGESGLQNTIDFLSTLDVVVTGAYDGEDAYLDIPVLECDGITFAFVSATQPTNGLSLPSSSNLVAPLIEDDGGAVESNPQVQEFLAQIQRATEVADVVVANVHWGSEYTYTPSSFQTQVAQLMADAGADIIYGHHPHVIQPLEYLTCEDGRQAIVCYSLGNFISCQDQGARMIGGMVDVAVTKDSDGSITLSDVTFSPVITHYGSNYSNVTTYPYEDYTPELALSHGVRTNTPSFSYDFIYNLVTDVIDLEFLPQDFLDLYGPSAAG